MFEILEAASIDRLAELDIEFHDLFAASVVLAAEGYPQSPVKGRLIHGLSPNPINADGATAWINHAGTGFNAEGHLISIGGRVLSCSASGPTLEASVKLAYELINTIELEGSHFRTVIAFRALRR